MSLNTYKNIESSKNLEVFEFYSVGKTSILKRVRFEPLDESENLYNLVLCTVYLSGDEDCESASRNGDMFIILETVGYIAKIFSDKYPNRKIFFAGSDALRTRRYQQSIYSFYKLISDFFFIEGIELDNYSIKNREIFKPGKNYDGFIFTRR